jgi:STE24 endopeptidase
MLSLFGLLALPVFNSFSRAIENEADVYSLRTENRPDGLASALVKTADYRNPRPGRIEEIIFYSHPSVERRVRRAMAWKAAHPGPPGGG